MLDLEQMLGANWLSKIGVAVLVLGVAFFLAWQLRELGPAGKVVVGVVVSILLLAAGIWGERFERYRILARAGLAGGWSLLFFTAYASHHIAAARVVHSALAGFVLMLAVVAAMVAHTLRFRSQVVTGLAFALAFSTVAINRVDVYSLTANVALAIGFSFVVVRMRWFKLEVLGIVATYLNHFLWLIPVIAPMKGKVHPFPEFYASAAILALYWAIFRVSYVVRRAEDDAPSTLAGVLNTALLLAVMKYQSAHPELAFYALLTLGAIELMLSRLPNMRRKRMSFLVLTSIGAVLVVAAIPFRYAPQYVAPVWLLEAALLVFIGVVTNERAYRRLGFLAGVATAVQLLAVPGARLLGARLGGGYPVQSEWILGAIFAAAMLALYAAAEWLPRRWPAMFDAAVDRRMARYLSYLAAVMGFAAGWVTLPVSGAAVFWIALALVVAFAAHRLGAIDLRIQANALAAITVLRVLIVNLPKADARLLTVSIVVAGMYLLSRWNGWPDLATWVASALVALFAWYQLLPISVAVAWTMAGVVLVEIGLLRASLQLRAQGYALLAIAFARVFVVNMNAEQARLYTIVPILIAFLYVFERAHVRLFAWLAAAGALALLRFELLDDVVAIAWAALALVLVAAALSGRRVFLHIGIATAVLTLARGVLHNLYERSFFPPPANAPRWLLVGIVSALLVATLPFAFRLRQVDRPLAARPFARLLAWLDARPEQILFFVPVVLVTALLATETRAGMLTIAWGAEAVVVFLAALWIGERSYRLTGLVLLLLCVGKIFVFDFWSLSLRDKALTGMLIGAALIGVSILYARKREAILQFL
jgi:hypothetical protein